MDVCDAKYLWLYVNDEAFWHRSGSAQPFIKPSDVKGAWLALPPLHEQRRIAAIVSSVDNAMGCHAGGHRSQLASLKKGLMAELLTRGLPGD